MEYRKLTDKYVVRLDPGDEIVGSLKSLCTKENIELGKISGIGAVNKAEVGLFEISTKKYHSKVLTGDMEIVSLKGNISEMDGEIYLHLHIALSNMNLEVFGGHLNSATISATGEIIIDTIDGRVDRRFNQNIGLNLLKLD